MNKQDSVSQDSTNPEFGAAVVRQLNDAFRGRRCAGIRPDHEWVLEFGDGLGVVAGGFWRIRDGGRVAIARGDHQQLFGLKTPVDAGAVAREVLGDRGVTQVAISPAGGDLFLAFDGDVHLEVFVDSSGYESWKINAGGLQVIGRGHDQCVFGEVIPGR